MKRRNVLVLSLLFITVFALDIQGQEKKELLTNGKSFVHKKRPKPPQNQNNNCSSNEFRTIDGTCNNLTRQGEEYGASDIELYRAMFAEYGSTDHYNSMGGEERLSAREISNTLCVEGTANPSPRGLSSFVFTWGQFLDHDISLTPEAHVEYEPITLPADEPLFTADIPFFRSAVYSNTGIDDYRQQTNLITSWIDASNVYGSETERTAWLRTNIDGKMKTSAGGLLPFNTLDGEYDSDIDISAPSMAGDGGGTVKTFVAGDVRAGEQPGLTALHTLFLRTHNNICDRLITKGVTGDEEIFQKARKEVGAIVQNITYKEFLPALGIRLNRHRGYNDRVQADITNLFATAAYRLGHTMVTDELLLLNNDCAEVDGGSLSLLDGFFNPEIMRQYSIEPILKGLSVQTQNEVDLEIIDNLRNFLFGDPGSGSVFGLDLASLNIQRGRDHGLPSYNEVRKKYHGRYAENFRDISRNSETQDLLESVYDSVDDVDLWIGLLAEDKTEDTSLGSTLHKILEKQFEALRDGDRFYFEHDKHLSRRDKDRIKSTSLAEIIEINSGLTNMPSNVFFASNCNDNKISTRSQGLNVVMSAKAYPNPVNNILTVEYRNNNSSWTAIELYDTAGRKIKKIFDSSGIVKVDVSSLKSGSYIVVIHNEGQTESLSFIIQE